MSHKPLISPRLKHAARYRRWTAAEEQEILELVQAGMSWPQIERKTGRSTASIWAHFTSIGQSIRDLRRTVGGCRSTYELSQLMGVGAWLVDRWVAAGEIAATRLTKTQRIRYVTDDALMAFLADRAAWPDWEPAAITDPDWRAYAQELRDAAGGRWLDTTALVQRYHVSQQRAWEWCKHGLIPGRYRRGRFWYVWSAALEGWQPPYATTDYAGRNRRMWAAWRERRQKAS
jgi:hypothetical protein